MWQLELLVVSEWVCRVLHCNVHSQQLLQRLKERAAVWSTVDEMIDKMICCINYSDVCIHNVTAIEPDAGCLLCCLSGRCVQPSMVMRYD